MRLLRKAIPGAAAIMLAVSGPAAAAATLSGSQATQAGAQAAKADPRSERQGHPLRPD